MKRNGEGAELCYAIQIKICEENSNGLAQGHSIVRIKKLKHAFSIAADAIE
jgi:hypothetical protein